MKMRLLLPCVYMLLLCSCGADSDKSASGTEQHADTALATGTQQKAPTKDEITEAYVKAIGDYIKEMYKNGKPLPDTLFIGKHPDFPDIALPPTIEGANIALVTGEEGQQKLNYRKTLVYLNVMGWIEKEEAELLIVPLTSSGRSITFRYSISGPQACWYWIAKHLTTPIRRHRNAKVNYSINGLPLACATPDHSGLFPAIVQ